ncbi:MAG: hypothetical protein WDO70_11835 [Alphaproteobacteria bacterium]
MKIAAVTCFALMASLLPHASYAQDVVAKPSGTGGGVSSFIFDIFGLSPKPTDKDKAAKNKAATASDYNIFVPPASLKRGLPGKSGNSTAGARAVAKQAAVTRQKAQEQLKDKISASMRPVSDMDLSMANADPSAPGGVKITIHQKEGSGFDKLLSLRVGQSFGIPIDDVPRNCTLETTGMVMSSKILRGFTVEKGTTETVYGGKLYKINFMPMVACNYAGSILRGVSVRPRGNQYIMPLGQLPCTAPVWLKENKPVTVQFYYQTNGIPTCRYSS